jgi:1,2-diacylglycerol 3-alpha-glucosyltransferase
VKIAHLCLSCFYIDGYSYQENELVRQNVRDGHEVVVIASTETYDDKGKLCYVPAREYMGTDGARVVRVKYSGWLPQSLMRKLRIHPGIFEILSREAPDVILFHGVCGWELQTIRAYKSANPAARVFADSHEDFNNSARSFTSRNILHKVYYRSILLLALNSLEKVLCVSTESISFVRDFYGVPSEKLEFFPLGGYIFSDDEYARVREATRSEYGLLSEQILFVQSGKMDASKRILESLRAFASLGDPHVRFILVGHLHDDVADEAAAIIASDARIRFVGWKSPHELRALLCAADVYVQPGTQSATMQMSLCCRCAVILDDVVSHEPYVKGNGWLVGKRETLRNAMVAAQSDLDRLRSMSVQSAKLASKTLDYRSLAARLYQ